MELQEMYETKLLQRRVRDLLNIDSRSLARLLTAMREPSCTNFSCFKVIRSISLNFSKDSDDKMFNLDNDERRFHSA